MPDAGAGLTPVQMELLQAYPELHAWLISATQPKDTHQSSRVAVLTGYLARERPEAPLAEVAEEAANAEAKLPHTTIDIDVPENIIQALRNIKGEAFNTLVLVGLENELIRKAMLRVIHT